MTESRKLSAMEGLTMEDCTRLPALRLASIACPHCGTIDTPAIAPGAGPHPYRANCAHCGTFLKWVSPHSPEEREARRQRYRQQALEDKPPSQAQLRFLQILGDDGPPPANMHEASARIDTLKRERGVA